PRGRARPAAGAPPPPPPNPAGRPPRPDRQLDEAHRIRPPGPGLARRIAAISDPLTAGRAQPAFTARRRTRRPPRASGGQNSASGDQNSAGGDQNSASGGQNSAGGDPTVRAGV